MRMAGSFSSPSSVRASVTASIICSRVGFSDGCQASVISWMLYFRGRPPGLIPAAGLQVRCIVPVTLKDPASEFRIVRSQVHRVGPGDSLRRCRVRVVGGRLVVHRVAHGATSAVGLGGWGHHDPLSIIRSLTRSRTAAVDVRNCSSVSRRRVLRRVVPRASACSARQALFRFTPILFSSLRSSASSFAVGAWHTPAQRDAGRLGDRELAHDGAERLAFGDAADHRVLVGREPHAHCERPRLLGFPSAHLRRPFPGRSVVPVPASWLSVFA